MWGHYTCTSITCEEGASKVIYLQIFLAFFIPNIIGFGGGPSTIPLIQKEVVEHYQFMTLSEYSSLIAIGNMLPGPAATKLAGYIGYELAGIPGAIIALFATIAPTMLLMLALLSILTKYKDSLRVKRITIFIIPIIGALMLQLTFKFLLESANALSWVPTVLAVIASYIALERFKLNPALVIISALIIGALFASYE